MDIKYTKILDLKIKWIYTLFIVFNFIFTSLFPQLAVGLLWFFYAYY